MIDLAIYHELVERVAAAGYAYERAQSQDNRPCDIADEFGQEAAWVILCSGMKEQVARTIWNRIRPQLHGLKVASITEFGHKGKCAAIKEIWNDRLVLLRLWIAEKRSVDWLERLPWIGPITKWHLAKNLGVDCCKPDRHLERIGQEHGESPAAMCGRLANASGDRVSTVDVVLWRAANLGYI